MSTSCQRTLHNGKSLPSVSLLILTDLQVLYKFIHLTEFVVLVTERATNQFQGEMDLF